MKHKLILPICLFLFFNCSTFAQDLESDVTTVSLEIYYNYQVEGKVNRILSTFFLPQNLPNKQRIINIEYSIPPHKIFESGDNQYIEFIFDQPKESFVLKMKMDVELYRYDLEMAQYNELSNNSISTDKYLRNELFLRRKNKLIQGIADTISGNTQLETVQNIYDFVTDHLEYNDDIRENLGSIKALKKGYGDCTEYADLFVTLCRAKEIPARVVAGCVAELSLNSNHHWAEVFLEDTGWIPFDPTYGDSQASTFDEMPNKYIYYSNNRTDKVLFSGNGRHKWWVQNRLTGDVRVSSFYDTQYGLEHKFRKAKRLYLHQNYTEAKELIDDLLASDPKSSRYHAFRGLLLVEEGKEFEAYKEIQKALLLATNNLLKQNAYYSLSNICASRGEQQLALSFLKGALEMGTVDVAAIKASESFADLLKNENFKSLLEQYEVRETGD
ncbi:MAG: transglutaminase domain-containing protein [Chitinophagales bacterium]